MDLGYKGSAYTWTNRQYTSNPINHRLDCVLVTSIWQEKYPTSYVNHLPMIYSDHAPIFLRMTTQIRGKADEQQTQLLLVMNNRHDYYKNLYTERVVVEETRELF
jgi:hypothetical protein